MDVKFVGLEGMDVLDGLQKNIKAVAQITLHKSGHWSANYIKAQMSRAGSPSRPGGYPGVRSGDLKSSISYRVSGWGALEFGSNIDYAKYLNDGTNDMGARPFIKLAIDHVVDNIVKTFINSIDKAIK